jgi:hypothetical protein
MSEPIVTLKITFDDISEDTKTQLRQFLQLCSCLIIGTIIYMFSNIIYKTYHTFRQIKCPTRYYDEINQNN